MHNAELGARAYKLRREATPAERVLWEAVRRYRKQGFTFRRQQVIGSFIVDFYCDRAALVVEVDGDVHASQLEYDREREAMLMARALKVLRFTNEQVLRDLSAVLISIEAQLEPR